MLNLVHLHGLINDTTVPLRKTNEVVQRGNTVEIYSMPAQNDEGFAYLEKVDMVFIIVGVDKDKATARRDELIEILKGYPNQTELSGGPSYITVGAAIGDQQAALQLFALGQVLNLWKVITPETMGVGGPDDVELAGRGFVMITGFDRNAF